MRDGESFAIKSSLMFLMAQAHLHQEHQACHSGGTLLWEVIQHSVAPVPVSKRLPLCYMDHVIYVIWVMYGAFGDVCFWMRG